MSGEAPLGNLGKQRFFNGQSNGHHGLYTAHSITTLLKDFFFQFSEVVGLVDHPQEDLAKLQREDIFSKHLISQIWLS